MTVFTASIPSEHIINHREESPFEDSLQDGIQFIRDDMGEWYARTTVSSGRSSEQRCWHVGIEMSGSLDAAFEEATES